VKHYNGCMCAGCVRDRGIAIAKQPTFGPLGGLIVIVLFWSIVVLLVMAFSGCGPAPCPRDIEAECRARWDSCQEAINAACRHDDNYCPEGAPRRQPLVDACDTEYRNCLVELTAESEVAE